MRKLFVIATMDNQQLSNYAVPKIVKEYVGYLKDIGWCKANIQYQTDLKTIFVPINQM